MLRAAEQSTACRLAQPEAPSVALTSALLPHPYTSQVCATCMQPLAEAAAPCYCPRCPLPAYCSAACREADRFHRPGGPECGRPWTVLLPAEALAALRLAWQLRQELGGTQQPAQGGPRQRGSQVERSAAAAQVAALGTHLQEMEAGEAAQLAALAAVAHATLQQAAAEAALASGSGSSSSSGSSSPSSSGGDAGGDSISAAEVLEALCRLQINGLAVVPPERHGTGDRLALALYPVGWLGHGSGEAVRAAFCRWIARVSPAGALYTCLCTHDQPACCCLPVLQVGSLMNHSCQPNMAVRFEASVGSVHAGGCGSAVLPQQQCQPSVWPCSSGDS